MQYTLADIEVLNWVKNMIFFLTLDPCLDMNMSPIMKLKILVFR